MPDPGKLEVEFGVPIPGEILPPEQWARTAIKKLPDAGPLDWAAIFGRVAPVVLDLGCGNGRFVVTSAVRRPGLDHVGLDILPVVIRYATRRGNQRGLTNTRFAVCGSFEFLEKYVAPHSVREIHVYHPQPYVDSEKSFRRLITPEFLALVVRSLEPAGRFVIQTDSPAYWQYIAATMPAIFDFHLQKAPWPDSPQGRTRREIIARSKGLPVFRAWGVPRPDVGAEQMAELVRNLPLPNFAAEAESVRPRQVRRDDRRRKSSRRK